MNPWLKDKDHSSLLYRLPSRPDMREYLSSQLHGQGIEFGAGNSPFPIPPTVKVLYADRSSVAELHERKVFDSEVVPLDLLSDLEAMPGIDEGSLDFIIASHVIEHTTNPLLALKSAYLKLRSGGKFLIVIPDKAATFDRTRALTPLSHIIWDFEQPSRERDFEHYVDFFTHAFPQPDPVAAALGPFEMNHDIHFHTWTYESFGEMVSYARETVSPWSEVWSHPRLPGPDIEGRQKIWYEDLEFYFLLVK
jgi:SAM-dependent methyltransferase